MTVPDRGAARPPSTSAAKTVTSRRCPGVRTRASGLPPPPQVHLDPEPAPAAAQRLRHRAPLWSRPRAGAHGPPPPPTQCTYQAICLAAPACRCTSAGRWPHTPACAQRRKRVYNLRRRPWRSSTSRQGAPVASCLRMTLMTARSSLRGRPPRWGGRSGANRRHSAAPSSWRRRLPHPRSTRTGNLLTPPSTSLKIGLHHPRPPATGGRRWHSSALGNNVGRAAPRSRRHAVVGLAGRRS